jgi:hypothetical protein
VCALHKQIMQQQKFEFGPTFSKTTTAIKYF